MLSVLLKALESGLDPEVLEEMNQPTKQSDVVLRGMAEVMAGLVYASGTPPKSQEMLASFAFRLLQTGANTEAQCWREAARTEELAAREKASRDN